MTDQDRVLTIHQLVLAYFWMTPKVSRPGAARPRPILAVEDRSNASEEPRIYTRNVA